MRSFSPSRYLDYAKCGKRYELTRVHRMPEPAAWYFVGGSAVHLATERWDKGDGHPLREIWEDAFEEVYTETFEKDPNEDEWRASKGYTGRGDQERYDEWMEKGFIAVQDWARWRLKHNTWDLLAVEEELQVELPSGSTFHGFVDRLFQTPSGRVIVDLKTGSRKPDSLFQLGVYACGYELTGQERPAKGLYWLSKYGTNQAEPSSLDTFSLHVITEMDRMLYAGIDNKVFLPIISSQCYMCPASDACYAFSGDTEMSRRYDPLNPSHASHQTDAEDEADATDQANPADQADSSDQTNEVT